MDLPKGDGIWASGDERYLIALLLNLTPRIRI
jgi:hypothetical protein